MIVDPAIGTGFIALRASSTPFWMAVGTSLALPYPTPTLPLPSPTATSAVNARRQPPGCARKRRRSPGRRCNDCCETPRGAAAPWCPAPGGAPESGAAPEPSRASSSRHPRLPCLAADDLIRVLDALALVGLGGADRADIGGHLADQFLVDAGDDDLGRLRHLEGDPVDRLDLHRVGVPDQQLEALAGGGGAVADAHHVELAAESLRDSDHHVAQQRPAEAMESLGVAGIVAAGDVDHSLTAGERHAFREGARQSPARPFDGHRGAVDGDIDPTGEGDGGVADPAHHPPPQTTPPPSGRRRASRSGSRPWDVEITTTPRPPWTRGRS